MKKLLEVLLSMIALVSALLGLALLCEGKKKDENYLTLYDESQSHTGN